MAVFLVATVGICALVGTDTEDSEAGFIIEPATEGKDYVKTSGTITLKVTNPTSDKVYCKWNLNDSSGKSQKNGTVEIEMNNSKEVEVTAPSTAGDYKFVVNFYNHEDKKDENHIADREMSVKVVEPVAITVTFENTSTNKVEFKAYLMVKDGDNWKKVDDSEKTVTVTAYNPDTKVNGSGTYTFDYIVKDLSRTTTYKVCSDEKVTEGIEGLNKEMKFYTSQNDYTFITWFLVILLIILVAVIIWIYRKPVKNFGKPKARR